MQLALLSGASPLTCRSTPVVRLQAGTWEFLVDGLNDSILTLHQNPTADGIQVLHERRFILLDRSEVKLEFVKKGKEKYITVNVKKV